MTRSELNGMLMGGTVILLIRSVADLAEGTWVEDALKRLAISLIVIALFALIAGYGKPQ